VETSAVKQRSDSSDSGIGITNSNDIVLSMAKKICFNFVVPHVHVTLAA